jgi:GNAT superfamily N-acetyltransferase
MAAPFPQIRPCAPDEHEIAAEALALAFLDDPAWAHLLPEAATRGERLLSFFMAEIGNLVPEHREVWIVQDGGGAAVWGPPGRWRVPLARTLGAARPMASVFGRRLALAAWTQLRMERRHPRSPRHWYLHYIGVEPRRQGRGLGGMLMAPVLERCDRDGTPAYLEASTDRSRVLYERNGFALSGTFDMPAGGPPLREMWREPIGQP